MHSIISKNLLFTKAINVVLIRRKEQLFSFSSPLSMLLIICRLFERYNLKHALCCGELTRADKHRKLELFFRSALIGQIASCWA